jgi:hypothetical protein
MVLALLNTSSGKRVPSTENAVVSSVEWVETVPANNGPLPSEPWIKYLFVKDSEIPAGWRTEGMTWYGEHEMPSLVVSYRTTPREIGVALSEEAAFYSTTLLAEQGYSRTLDQYFPPEYIKDWKDMPALVIPHHADSLKVACLSSKLNGLPFQACRSIARYQNLIVLTFGNVFEDKWLTMSGYRQMLEAVDRRVTDVLSQQSK